MSTKLALGVSATDAGAARGSDDVGARESDDLEIKVSHSTSQHVTNWNVYFYILNMTVGTGIFSLPSGIFAINGSVGITLFVWVIGALFAACGMCIFVELGSAMPRSGGEKNYLERIFRKPKYLVTCILAALYTLFGGSPASSLAFGSYIFHAAGYPDAKERIESRLIAVGCITAVSLLHAFAPKLGLQIIRYMGCYKLLLLVFIIFTGFAALAGNRKVPDPHNFDNAFSIGNAAVDGYGSGGLHGYATVLIRVGYAYGGFSSVTNILSEMKKPQRALRVATPLALGTIAVLYVLVNIAYFAAIPKEQFAKADVVIAAVLFENVFGGGVGGNVFPKVLSVLIAVASLGNVLAVSFDASRMNQELAKEGILPFSHFWASDKPRGAPTAALFLVWASTVVLLLAPPPGPTYNFLIDAAIYPRFLMGTLVCSGLLYLRLNPKENWSSPFKAPIAVICVWIVHHVFVTVMPLVPPPVCKSSDCKPYFLAPLIGICVIVTGALYWVVWAKLMPRWRGYDVVATRTAKEDGREMVQFSKVWHRETGTAST